MTLSEKISADLKDAMRSGDRIRLDALRMIRAALLELEKSGRKTTSDDEVKVLLKEAAKRKDAIDLYRNADRPERVEFEEANLRIIEEYLPRQLSEEEIRAEVRTIIEQTGAAGMSDFKVAMPKAMASLRGRADGARVQAILREELQAREQAS